MADTLRADILQKPDNTKLYHKIYSTWPRGPYVRLHIGNYPELFRLPQAFLEGCGQNSLRFVQELVQYCVQEPGHLSNLAQLGLELDDAPPPGQTLEFAAVEADTTFTWMPGPDGRYRGRAPAQDEAFDDTASLRPSEVSEMQVRLSAAKYGMSAPLNAVCTICMSRTFYVGELSRAILHASFPATA